MTISRAADRQSGALWSLAFRPFFLAAGLWAMLAIGIWTVMLTHGQHLPSRFDPLAWHIHAMLFGFVPAVVAGFMLTAIPNWTGRKPIRGAALASLVYLWLLGRVACLVSAYLPLWVAAAVDLAFPFALCIVAAREIVAAHNWRNLMMPLPIGVLGVANMLMYLELGGLDVQRGLGWRLAIAAIIALLSTIGGRIIPAFTRNWLVNRGATALPAVHGHIDSVALASLHIGLACWAVFPHSRSVGALLLFSATTNLWRLARWRGFASASEPLVAVLHLGYFWVVVGAAMLGAALTTNVVPEAAAIHAFTTGAVGTMVLAVMTRVARGHTGRPLEADRTTTVIYLMITAAALTRITAELSGHAFIQLLKSSAALWVLSFGLFIFMYGRMLIRPRANSV